MEINVTVQDLDAIFECVCVCVCVCVILSQVMLCCLAETILLHIFVISAIFLTLITESEERE